MKRVKGQSEALEASYKSLNQIGREPINYSELPTQAAYVFAYGMPRAYFTDEFLRRHRARQQGPLFREGELRVVSFGGGPASELVGLLNYLNDGQQGEKVTHVSHKIYDKVGDWKAVGEKLAASTGGSITTKVDYSQLDLADSGATDLVELNDANLIVFSYIMSELSALEGSQVIAQNVNRILGTMKSGTKMLFVESKVTDFIKYFKDCKGFNGREVNENVAPVNFELSTWPPAFARYAATLQKLPRMGSDKIISKWYVKS
jgi:hypothetical protein